MAESSDARAIATCLYGLLNHPDQRERMARNSRSVAQRFGLTAIIGRYEDLVIELLTRRLNPL